MIPPSLKWKQSFEHQKRSGTCSEQDVVSNVEFSDEDHIPMRLIICTTSCYLSLLVAPVKSGPVYSVNSWQRILLRKFMDKIQSKPRSINCKLFPYEFSKKNALFCQKDNLESVASFPLYLWKVSGVRSAAYNIYVTLSMVIENEHNTVLII